jgi:hypothetical protein
VVGQTTEFTAFRRDRLTDDLRADGLGAIADLGFAADLAGARPTGVAA